MLYRLTNTIQWQTKTTEDEEKQRLWNFNIDEATNIRQEEHLKKFKCKFNMTQYLKYYA